MCSTTCRNRDFFAEATRCVRSGAGVVMPDISRGLPWLGYCCVTTLTRRTFRTPWRTSWELQPWSVRQMRPHLTSPVKNRLNSTAQEFLSGSIYFLIGLIINFSISQGFWRRLLVCVSCPRLSRVWRQIENARPLEQSTGRHVSTARLGGSYDTQPTTKLLRSTRASFQPATGRYEPIWKNAVGSDFAQPHLDSA